MKRIAHLYISNNEIFSLESLRSSQFFQKQKQELVLDIRNNLISTIPYWMFDIQHSSQLFLSGNPIKYSCDQAPQYRQFLEAHKLEAKAEDCPSEAGSSHLLEVVIAGEILLLVALGNILYILYSGDGL